MDDRSFYSAAGTAMLRLLGERPEGFQKKIVNEFKVFIDAKGGEESFSDAEEAVKQFLRARGKYARK